MNTLDREIDSLRPILGDATTDALLARERREVFSIYPEVRLVAWAGAVLLATAIGLAVKRNFDLIGPIAVATAVAAIAIGCYAWCWVRRARASLADDYVLLLGALLVSADVAFVETQFHLLGGAWPRHFLVLAVVHGIAAYVFNSRMVLSLSISALAAWIGVELRPEGFDSAEPVELAGRAFTASAAILMWRALDARYHRGTTFSRTFEHFAANIALAAALGLSFSPDTRPIGCLLTLAIAAFAIWWGIRANAEPFVLYAFLYAVIAIDVALIDLGDSFIFVFLVLVSLVLSIIAIVAIHQWFRRNAR